MPPRLGSRTPTSIVIQLDDNNAVHETPSEPPGLGSRVSTSVKDGVIELDDEDGIDVLLFDDDSTGLASRMSTPRDNGAIDQDDDNGIMSSSSTTILLDSALVCLLRLTMVSSNLTMKMESTVSSTLTTKGESM